MKLRLLLCGLMLSAPVFADEPARFPLGLYLMPQSYIGSIIFAQAQINVTPSVNRTGLFSLVRRSYFSTNGTCTTEQGNSTDLNSTSTTLSSGQTYVSSDASTFAVFNGFIPTVDIQLYFAGADGNTPVGNLSPCIAPSQWVCNNATDCGFTSTINWTL